VLGLSARRGVIGHDAGELMQEIVGLTDLRARDVMVPRVDVIAYDVDAPPAGLAELFRKTRLKKVPVYRRDLDGVVGVVYAKRLLLTPQTPLRQLVEKVPFVPEAANLEKVLLQFRVTRAKTAIVVDEYGGTAGLVTLRDVLEEIVGNIPDPDEAARQPAVRKIGGREHLVDGHLAIHEWADAFRMDLSGRRISTVGGFVTSLLGRIPKAGDSVSYRNLRFTVESLRGRRIDKLRVELIEEGA
jgi:CBS domain containing-hemolysin-like protein